MTFVTPLPARGKGEIEMYVLGAVRAQNIQKTARSPPRKTRGGERKPEMQYACNFYSLVSVVE